MARSCGENNYSLERQEDKWREILTSIATYNLLPCWFQVPTNEKGALGQVEGLDELADAQILAVKLRSRL
jgi:hypothetical protein